MNLNKLIETRVALYLQNYFGVAGSVNNRDFRITKSGYKLFALTALKIKLEVSYSTSSPPRLEEVRLNGIVVCPVKFVSRCVL